MRIFVYHRVHPEPDPLWQPMHPRTFEEQLDWVGRFYEVAPLEPLLGDPEKARSNKYAAIVFDDGYQDYVDFALPVLRRKGFPSSMYVVTDCVDRGEPVWTYVFDYSFTNTEKMSSPLDYDLRPHEIRWSDTSERISYAKLAKQKLKNMEHSERQRVVQILLDHLDDVSIPSNMMMSWETIRTLGNDVEVGSHTVSHPLLATVSDPEIIRLELEQSKKRIETELGRKVATIAYPNGSHNEVVRKLAKEAGYEFGLAVTGVAYSPNRDDRYQISRIELYQEPHWKTALRALGVVQTAKEYLNVVRS